MSPAQPGNQLARKHGAFARFQLEPRARELAEDLRALLPSGSPIDDVAIRLLSLALAQVEAATLYVAAEGMVDSAGQPQPILKHLGTMLSLRSFKRERSRASGHHWQCAPSHGKSIANTSFAASPKAEPSK
jgi:hypothetical protein